MGRRRCGLVFWIRALFLFTDRRASLIVAGVTAEVGYVTTEPETRAHDAYYGRLAGTRPDSPEKFIEWFERTEMSPFHAGGNTKGYVRGLATRRLIEAASKLGRPRSDITVLDAGCGQGNLALYLACIGFHAIGVDLSPVAVIQGKEHAATLGVTSRCEFLAESLAALPLERSSVDFVIGHAALHHFIKYPGIAGEFARVLRPGGEAYFADSWGENRAFRIFHDRAKMAELGDVSLTKPMVEGYFGRWFDVSITPTDWTTMLDKLVVRASPDIARRLSRGFRAVDNRIGRSPGRLRLTLAGAVMTSLRRL